MSFRARSLLLLAAALILAAAALLAIARGMQGSRARPPAGPPAPDPAESLVGAALPGLRGAEAWIGPAGSLDSLRGSVVAVVFWSASEPRSLRAVQEAQAWHEAFASHGLRVLGVHVPQFEFSSDSAWLRRSVQRLGLTFPVAFDPALLVTAAFGASSGRARLVLADGRGTVVADLADPIAWRDAQARLLRQLEALRPGTSFPAAPASPGAGAQEPVLHEPVHLGRARVRGGPLADAVPGRPLLFTAQFQNQIEGAPYTPYPVGRWILGGEGLTAAQGGAASFVALRYDAGSLGAVLGPPEGKPARVWILRDEEWLPAQALGADARLDGRGASYVLVDAPRLYSIARESAGDHVVKLSPEEPGVTVYSFTFEPFGPVPVAGP